MKTEWQNFLMHFKDQLTLRSSGQRGQNGSHALERPVDPKKLRVKGGSIYHALERSVDLKELRVEGGQNESCIGIVFG